MRKKFKCDQLVTWRMEHDPDITHVIAFVLIKRRYEKFMTCMLHITDFPYAIEQRSYKVFIKDYLQQCGYPSSEDDINEFERAFWKDHACKLIDQI